MTDSAAFCPGPRVRLAPARPGSLSGLSFAAKDNFDVAGFVTGAGNPDWARTHSPAGVTARAVRLLLDAGAELVGKTQMDELAWGTIGANAHYGTPPNPAAPERVPGGSSSGSASAVAAGLADFALGTDSACSVRLPAAACGLYGIRPTHERVSLEGVVPLSPTLDTVGWLTRDAALLESVGRVLLPADGVDGSPIESLLVDAETFELASPAIRAALAPSRESLEARLGAPRDVRMIEPGHERGLPWLFFREWEFQAREAWATHGAWIEATKPDSRVLSRENFAIAADSTAQATEQARATFAALRDEIRGRIPRGSALCLPTLCELPARRGADRAEIDAFVRPTLCLLALAGIAGLPQVTWPVARVEGCPIGLSLVGARGSDESLLRLMTSFAEVARA